MSGLDVKLMPLACTLQGSRFHRLLAFWGTDKTKWKPHRHIYIWWQTGSECLILLYSCIFYINLPRLFYCWLMIDVLYMILWGIRYTKLPRPHNVLNDFCENCSTAFETSSLETYDYLKQIFSFEFLPSQNLPHPHLYFERILHLPARNACWTGSPTLTKIIGKFDKNILILRKLGKIFCLFLTIFSRFLSVYQCT